MEQQDRIIKKLAEQQDRMAEQQDRMAEQQDRFLLRQDRMAEQQDRVVQKLVELDEYVHVELATKNELISVKDELLLHIDGQSKKQETSDQELAVLRYRVDGIETRL